MVDLTKKPDARGQLKPHSGSLPPRLVVPIEGLARMHVATAEVWVKQFRQVAPATPVDSLSQLSHHFGSRLMNLKPDPDEYLSVRWWRYDEVHDTEPGQFDPGMGRMLNKVTKIGESR